MRNILKICRLRKLMNQFPKQNYCMYKFLQIQLYPCTYLTHPHIFYSVLSSPEADADPKSTKFLIKEFPEPKKIFSQVLNEAFLMNENLDLRPSISSQQISFDDKGGFLWQVTISMKWPEDFIVEGVANKKSEAETIAFLNACQKFKNLGILDNSNRPLLQNKQSFNENNVKNCKTDLLNIYQHIWVRHGKKEYIPKFISSSFKGVMEDCNFWKSQLHLIYPENKVFEATALRVKDADNIAAAKALLWLYSQGLIDNKRRLILYSKEDEMKLKQLHQTPYPICIPQAIQDRIENALSELKKLKSQLANKDEFENNEFSEDNFPISRNFITEEIYYEPSEDELYQRNWQLFEKRRLFENRLDSSAQNIRITRSSLPVFQKRDDILKLLDENQVVVLSGETGCGKSTQIPQYILDHYIDQKMGSKCNIIVTEPRRISAISLANRVAEERGETVGDTIGYQIRLSKSLPSGNGAILYCTTGILLRKLYTKSNLDGISHIIVDEAHERNIHIDFLLIILKQILQVNKDIRILLMSASFNTFLFSQYFNSCPVIHVPGKTYHVKEYFLEDIVQDIHYIKDVEKKKPILNIHLLINVIWHINETKPPGAILCFLPGWHDIRTVHSKLLENDKIAGKIYICPIHSRLPKEEQLHIFDKPDAGKRKVILATNIAETSITINDVVYVVNSGLHKGTTLDAEAGISSLTVQWITKANVRQRRGRAGRVQPGICYHLFTRKTFMEMEEYPAPEILRTPLESVVLNCKTYYPDSKAEDFLCKAIQPPPSSSIQSGVKELQILGILDDSENLTDLGKVVSVFPTHPRLSVALMYGTFLRCLDPILTICSILTLEKEPFMNTLDDKLVVRKVKEVHDNGICSDHLALNNIFNTFKSLLSETEVSEYIEKYMLDNESLIRIEYLKQLFSEELFVNGLINRPNSYCDPSSKCNENSKHILTILTALTAAFYPNIIKVIQGEISQGKLHKDTIIYSLIKGQKAYIQKESVVSEKEKLPSPFLIYFSAMKSEARRLAMISSLSSVPGICLMFTGKNLSIQDIDNGNENSAVLLIDGNKRLNFLCSTKEARLLLDMQEYWNEIFQLYVQYLRTKNHQNYEYITSSQNELFSVLKAILDSPHIPFARGFSYEFVDNELIKKEL